MRRCCPVTWTVWRFWWSTGQTSTTGTRRDGPLSTWPAVTASLKSPGKRPLQWFTTKTKQGGRPKECQNTDREGKTTNGIVLPVFDKEHVGALFVKYRQYNSVPVWASISEHCSEIEAHTALRLRPILARVPWESTYMVNAWDGDTPLAGSASYGRGERSWNISCILAFCWPALRFKVGLSQT